MKKILMFVVFVFVVIGCSNTPKEVKYDFSTDYDVKSDNPFVKVDAKEVLETLDSDGIIIFAFSDCPYCQLVMPVLSDVGTKHGLTDIKYFDVKDDRAKDSKDYQKMVEKLKEYLPLDDNEQPRIFVPHIFFIRDGQVIAEHANVLEGREGNKNPLSNEEYDKLFKLLEDNVLNYLDTEFCEIDKKEGC